MEGTSIAQSARAMKAPKVLERMEIKPRLGGGHIITHHYSSYQHEPKAHEFAKDEGEEAIAHIAKHAGLPHPKIGEEEGDEPEVVHPDRTANKGAL